MANTLSLGGVHIYVMKFFASTSLIKFIQQHNSAADIP